MKFDIAAKTAPPVTSSIRDPGSDRNRPRDGDFRPSRPYLKADRQCSTTVKVLLPISNEFYVNANSC